MKVYVTKYCLTNGIIEADLGKFETHYIGKLSWDNGPSIYSLEEAFESLAEAKANAEERRKKKIKSLEKKIEKLQALRF